MPTHRCCKGVEEDDSIQSYAGAYRHHRPLLQQWKLQAGSGAGRRSLPALPTYRSSFDKGPQGTLEQGKMSGVPGLSDGPLSESPKRAQ